MAASTRSLVSGFTISGLLMTLEMVCRDTPSSPARLSSVGRDILSSGFMPTFFRLDRSRLAATAKLRSFVEVLGSIKSMIVPVSTLVKGWMGARMGTVR